MLCKLWKIKKPRDLENLQVKFYVDYDAFLQVTGMPRACRASFALSNPLS